MTVNNPCSSCAFCFRREYPVQETVNRQHEISMVEYSDTVSPEQWKEEFPDENVCSVGLYNIVEQNNKSDFGHKNDYVTCPVYESGVVSHGHVKRIFDFNLPVQEGIEIKTGSDFADYMVSKLVHDMQNHISAYARYSNLGEHDTDNAIERIKTWLKDHLEDVKTLWLLGVIMDYKEKNQQHILEKMILKNKNEKNPTMALIFEKFMKNNLTK